MRSSTLFWVTPFLIMALLLFSCQKEIPETIDKSEPVSILKDAGDCFLETNLIAGQFYDVGQVFVTHDESFLYVSYHVTEPGWCLTETHLHVATSLAGIPMTKSGNPKVGNFEYSGYHNCAEEYTYTIPLAWAPGAELVIAAHAVVHHSEGDNPQRSSFVSSGNETAWAEGTSFPGNNWAMYVNFTLCDDGTGGLGMESEKAYGYAPAGSGIQSQCFLDLGISDYWGFMVGPFAGEATFELWALPNTCEFTNGFLVGQVTVSPQSGNKLSVTFSMYSGFSLDEAHLWVSNNPWPDGTMVDPEEFPYHAYELGGSYNYTFTNVSARDAVYMIIYAKVFGVIHVG